MTFILTFIAALLFYLVLIFCWGCLVWGIKKTGLRSGVGFIALELSIFIFCWYCFRDEFLAAILYGLFPPLALLDIIPWFNQQSLFLAKVAPIALPVGIGCAVLTRVVRGVNRGVLFVFLASMATAAVISGERFSQKTMCDAALRLGVEEIKRNSLIWSLQNATREFQFELHGEAIREGKTLAWSYREMDWYPLLPSIHSTIEHDKITNCGS